MPAYGYSAGDLHYKPGLFHQTVDAPKCDSEHAYDRWREQRHVAECINRDRTANALISHLHNGAAVREFDGTRTVVWSLAKMQAVFIAQTAESIARHLVKRSFGFGYELELLGI